MRLINSNIYKKQVSVNKLFLFFVCNIVFGKRYISKNVTYSIAVWCG